MFTVFVEELNPCHACFSFSFFSETATSHLHIELSMRLLENVLFKDVRIPPHKQFCEFECHPLHYQLAIMRTNTYCWETKLSQTFSQHTKTYLYRLINILKSSKNLGGAEGHPSALRSVLLFPASCQARMLKTAFLLIFQHAGFWSQMEPRKAEECEK